MTEPAVPDIISVFRAKKLRATPQRIAIYTVILRERKHLTAEEIYGKIKRTLPALSLATIYTTVEAFKRSGMVKEVWTDPHKARFDIRTEAHHHFYCRHCKRTMDIEIHPCPSLRKKEVDGHLIEELHGVFSGLCRECRRDSAE